MGMIVNDSSGRSFACGAPDAPHPMARQTGSMDLDDRKHLHSRIGVDWWRSRSIPMRSKTFTFPIALHSLRPEKINAKVPELPRGTTFFDVEGVPVTLSPDGREARAGIVRPAREKSPSARSAAMRHRKTKPNFAHRSRFFASLARRTRSPRLLRDVIVMRSHIAPALVSLAAATLVSVGDARAAPSDEIKGAFSRFITAQNAHDRKAVDNPYWLPRSSCGLHPDKSCGDATRPWYALASCFNARGASIPIGRLSRS